MQLSNTEIDIQRLLMGSCHVGTMNCSKHMTKYVFGKNNHGNNIIDIQKTYEKIKIAARIIASIPEASSIHAVSGRTYGQRAVYKFAQHTGAVSCAGRWSPGMLTNQNSAKTFVEPRLLIVADPRIDYNALLESTYVNIPIIALCNTDNNLAYVDCAIPCNNRSKFSLAMVMWLLTKEVMTLRGEESNFNDMPDLFMWRDVEKEKKKNKLKKLHKEMMIWKLKEMEQKISLMMMQ